MKKIISERMAAEIEGDFVVFIIGMRINSPWKVHKWLPVFRAMPRMLKELVARPDSGFLGSISGGLLIVQYWRSFKHLEAYARDQDQLHWPAWKAFNKRVRRSRADVGIWHETYQVRAESMKRFTAACPLGGWDGSARYFRLRDAENLRADVWSEMAVRNFSIEAEEQS
jgi:hypothetical protein